MKLFHGSNQVVDSPEIRRSTRPLDFGDGFYLTSSRSQASSWATSVAKRRRSGDPILNIYNIDELVFDTLNILSFESANEDWLDFVVDHRMDRAMPNTNDVVIGPVANDSTLPVINEYMNGTYPKRIAIELLKPQNLTDQYAFLTTRALEFLTFEGGIRL